MTWFERNWGYFAFFGGLLVPTLVVSFMWAWAGKDAMHVGGRQLLHLGWGALLYMLFSRLALVGERQAKVHFGWMLWYFLPIALVLAAALNQEFGWTVRDWQIQPGDYRHFEDPVDKAKSFSDIPCWLFGAIVAAWRDYFMGHRLVVARNDYLTGLKWWI